MFKRAGAIATGKRKKHISPKPRRAHQEEVSLATTMPTSTAATTTTPEPPTNIEPQLEVSKIEEELKEEVEEELDNDTKENKELVNEEAAKRCEVISEGVIPDGDSEKITEECTNTTGPLTEEEPSVASQLMGGEGEGDNLSVEGLVMSEDEREGLRDKVIDQVGVKPVSKFQMYYTATTICRTKMITLNFSVAQHLKPSRTA